MNKTRTSLKNRIAAGTLATELHGNTRKSVCTRNFLDLDRRLECVSVWFRGQEVFGITSKSRGSSLRSLVFVAATIFGAAVPSAAAAADSWPHVWINPGLYSYHFDRSTDHRENNSGIGVELQITDDHMLMAGSYINSAYTRSHYALYAWRPLHWEASSVRFSAGIAIAAFDGYESYNDGALFFAPLPLLAVEWKRLGVNFTYVPAVNESLDAAIAIQLKLRVWP